MVQKGSGHCGEELQDDKTLVHEWTLGQMAQGNIFNSAYSYITAIQTNLKTFNQGLVLVCFVYPVCSAGYFHGLDAVLGEMWSRLQACTSAGMERAHYDQPVA